MRIQKLLKCTTCKHAESHSQKVVNVRDSCRGFVLMKRCKDCEYLIIKDLHGDGHNLQANCLLSGYYVSYGSSAWMGNATTPFRLKRGEITYDNLEIIVDAKEDLNRHLMDMTHSHRCIRKDDFSKSSTRENCESCKYWEAKDAAQ